MVYPHRPVYHHTQRNWQLALITASWPKTDPLTVTSLGVGHISKYIFYIKLGYFSFLSLSFTYPLSLSVKRRSFWHWLDTFLTLNVEVRESLGSKFALKF
ncbi:hypothetical protein ACOSP7_028269 [Xanthoceras sorbifolium]